MVEVFLLLGHDSLLLPSIFFFSWMLFLDGSGTILSVLRGGGDLTVAEDSLNVDDAGAATETGQKQRSLFRVVKQVWTPNADVALESFEPTARTRPASQPLPGASGP